MKSADRPRFGPFEIDPANRRLTRDGAPVDLSARYFDALTLLARHPGALVTKDRFMDEVWRGVPVTDEALTQCIRSLRRVLGDDAASPRFIETVPKHGYRFIADLDEAQAAWAPAPSTTRAAPVRIIAGGAIAGVIGGLLYGSAAASSAQAGSVGGLSVLLVMMALTVTLGALGAAGVAAGIGIARRLLPGAEPVALILGGATGGLVLGGVIRLLGIDAFALLFGTAPATFTGAPEGLAIGSATGLSLALGHRMGRRVTLLAALAIGALAGLAVAIAGGQLLAGSIAELAAAFPGSRLRLDALGALFGETGLGPRTLVATAIAEGAIFAACVTAADRAQGKASVPTSRA